MASIAPKGYVARTCFPVLFALLGIYCGLAIPPLSSTAARFNLLAVVIHVGCLTLNFILLSLEISDSLFKNQPAADTPKKKPRKRGRNKRKKTQESVTTTTTKLCQTQSSDPTLRPPGPSETKNGMDIDPFAVPFSVAPCVSMLSAADEEAKRSRETSTKPRPSSASQTFTPQASASTVVYATTRPEIVTIQLGKMAEMISEPTIAVTTNKNPAEDIAGDLTAPRLSSGASSKSEKHPVLQSVEQTYTGINDFSASPPWPNLVSRSLAGENEERRSHSETLLSEGGFDLEDSATTVTLETRKNEAQSFRDPIEILDQEYICPRCKFCLPGQRCLLREGNISFSRAFGAPINNMRNTSLSGNNQSIPVAPPWGWPPPEPTPSTLWLPSTWGLAPPKPTSGTSWLFQEKASANTLQGALPLATTSAIPPHEISAWSRGMPHNALDPQCRDIQSVMADLREELKIVRVSLRNEDSSARVSREQQPPSTTEVRKAVTVETVSKLGDRRPEGGGAGGKQPDLVSEQGGNVARSFRLGGAGSTHQRPSGLKHDGSICEVFVTGDGRHITGYDCPEAGKQDKLALAVGIEDLHPKHVVIQGGGRSTLAIEPENTAASIDFATLCQSAVPPQSHKHQAIQYTFQPNLAVPDIANNQSSKASVLASWEKELEDTSSITAQASDCSGDKDENGEDTEGMENSRILEKWCLPHHETGKEDFAKGKQKPPFGTPKKVTAKVKLVVREFLSRTEQTWMHRPDGEAVGARDAGWRSVCEDAFEEIEKEGAEKDHEDGDKEEEVADQDPYGEWQVL